MNECFLIGEVLSNPEFEFLYNAKRISISYFWIKVDNNSIIKVFGYDERADYIYRNIKKGEKLLINGKIRVESDIIEIEIIKIERFIK